MIGYWLKVLGPFVAAATALVIAIYHNKLSAWKHHPDLVPELIGRPPDCHKTFIVRRKTGEIADCFYFRLKVHNKGKAPASNVEVFLEEILIKHADGVYHKWEEFLPLNLRWSHFESAIFFHIISPDMYKHCDIGHIIDPQKLDIIEADDLFLMMRHQRGDIIFNLDFATKPLTGTYILKPGEYRLNLVISAANAKVVKKRIDLNVRGIWAQDQDRMLSEGIGISLNDRQ
jgi:hypothetical protein